MSRSRASFLLCFTLVVAASSAAAGVPASPSKRNPVPSAVRPAAHPIPGSYIAVLRDLPSAGVSRSIASLAARYGVVIEHSYSHALKGFSFQGMPVAAEALARSPLVNYVEQDGVVNADATQSSPPWGLDRIDQRDLPLSASYTYNATGSGVKAYIIDTGIRFTHAQFGGRATSGYDAVDGGSADDCNGHGTHVAGTVGGSTYCVAKSVSLIGVRVLDCQGSGSNSGVIAGVDWVTGNHPAGAPAVANMSLGGGASSALDTAVNNSINDGVSYAIAAGNGNILGMAQDACGTSPARVANAITVGATDSADKKASWSNYGTCLDIFGPGVNILSSWYTSDTATNTISGTSMAAPHVAGVAALYLQGNTSATPATVTGALINNATLNKVTSLGTGSPNRLLYMAFIGGGGGGNVAPTANFTSSCTGLTCTFTDTSTDSDGTIASRSWNFGDTTTSTATNPSKAYAAGGTYTVTLTVTDNGGATGSTSQSLTVSSGGGGDPDPGTPTLTNGVTKSDTNGATGTWKYYKIQVPSGRTSLRADLVTNDSCFLTCNPDLDLYVRKAAKPTTATYQCSGAGSTSDESCTVTNPATDWWYIGVYTYASTSSVSYTIKATY